MGSSKNTVLGFVLIFAILVGYYLITAPSKKELADQKRKQDSLIIVQQMLDSVVKAKQLGGAGKAVEQEQIDTIPPPIIQDSGNEFSAQKDKFGVFAHAAKGEAKTYYIENDLIKLGISTKGGRITYVELKKYKTWDLQPLILTETDTNIFGLTFFANNRTISTDRFFFEPYWPDASKNGLENMRLTGSEVLQFAMRLYASDTDSLISRDRYIEYLFTIRGDNYMMDFDVNFSNLEKTIDGTRGYIDFEWGADQLKQEKIVDKLNGTTIYYKLYQDKVEFLSENKDNEKSLKDKIQWVSFKQPFFVITLVAKSHFVDPVMRTYTSKNPPNPRYLRSTYFKVGVPYSGSGKDNIAMSVYFGPNKYNILRKYKLDLERQIPLGWSFFLMQWINRFAVLPVFNFLGSFGWNYGIVILVLTILLKIVLFPIAYKTYLSSARMKILKPEVDEIGAKFPKKEDSMKKQQAIMALYKKAGVNPMSGCIPILLQMPILIAMFRFFPASIELRQQSFLWATDLSSYDSIFDLGFNIPFYGDHVSLFTLLMTISTIIYTYLNNKMMGSGSQQMPGMKTMMYIMPVMFLGIFNNYSSGLSYYYLLVNLLTFAQMYIFMWFVDEDKLHRQMQENKAKPVKKSSFQKRLEDAAKKKGYKPNSSRR